MTIIDAVKEVLKHKYFKFNYLKETIKWLQYSYKDFYNFTIRMTVYLIVQA